jgi:hypothetical protein
LLAEYVRYHHEDRTHLGLEKATPDCRIRSVASGRAFSQERLGGLHHRSERSSPGNHPRGFHRCDHLEPELLIAIKDQVFVRRFKGKCLAQLLDDPTASWMLRDVNVQDAPPIMADDEEAVEYAEAYRWHSKEIHGCNGFPMVSKKGQPALGPIGIARRSFHPTGDGSLGKIKTEHPEFPMDPRYSPGGVVNDHTEDQFPNLLRRLPSSDLPPDSGN